MRTMLVGISVAAALGAPVAAAQARSQPFMGGLTRQHDPIVIKLSSSGRAIVEADAALDLKCSDGGETTFTDEFSHVPVSRSGRFHDRFDSGVVDLGGGQQAREQDAIAGRVRRGGALITGTWRMTFTDTDAHGATSTCRSGAVRFRITG